MKKMIGRILAVPLLVGVLMGSFALTAKALWPDPEIEAGVVRVMSAGLAAWRVGVLATGGNYDVQENANTGRTAMRFSAANGSYRPFGFTSTQLSTLAPDASGYMTVNITNATPCISTGTTAGAWVLPRSTATTANLIPCY